MSGNQSTVHNHTYEKLRDCHTITHLEGEYQLMKSNEYTREYQKALDYLHALIREGTLKLGDRLPTERAIASTLCISRNSTREALRMLENTGVIESRRGSGNYLVGNMSQNISGIIDMMLLLQQTSRREICDFRRNMEKAVCLAIMEQGTQHKISGALKGLLDSFEGHHSIAELVELDRKFHYSLIDATGNQFWIFLLESITDVYRTWIDTVLTTANNDVRQSIHASHTAMYQALIAGDRTACEAAIDRHYDLVDQQLDLTASPNL